MTTPHIALLMMVKDEEKRIRVSLDSVVGSVDSVIIYDTGSTDRTLEIINDFCNEHNLPLRLKHGTFINFAISRNVALDFADTFPEVDYYILLDANDELQNGAVLRTVALREAQVPERTGYLLCQRLKKTDGMTSFFNIRFIKARSDWRYAGAVHESFELNEKTLPKVAKLPDVILYQDRAEDEEKSKKRYARDKELLLKDYQEDPNNSRTVYYLAQTCDVMGDFEDAYKYHKIRSEMAGFVEEKFVSTFRLAFLSKTWEEKLGLYMRAYKLQKRVEPLLNIAEHYKEERDWGMAFIFCKLACDLEYPKDSLFYIEQRAYDFSRWYLLAVTAFNYRKYSEGYPAAKKIAETGGLQEKQILAMYEKVLNPVQPPPAPSNYFNEYFDKIFVINLTERQDRWEKVKEQLKQHGITNYERFAAIKIDASTYDLIDKHLISNLHYTPYVNDKGYQLGALGCRFSHYGIVKLAKERGYKKILILEDDIVIANNYASAFKNAVNDVPNWDMMYLGATFIRENTLVTANVAKVNGAFTTASYALCNERGIFDYILDNLPGYTAEIDVFYAYNLHYQGESKYSVNKPHAFQAYVTNPMVVAQGGSNSDIVPKGATASQASQATASQAQSQATERRPFSRYPNKVLVETGTYKGHGVQDALNTGFERVISFEIEPNLYKFCVDRFSDNSNVKIVHGSSVEKLYENIRDINVPITFWLDGHYSLGDTGYDENHICPLMYELDQIQQHHLKSHTILIDDRRLMVKTGKRGLDGSFEVTEQEVINKLREINPDYKIIYEDGHIPNDIIVATV